VCQSLWLARILRSLNLRNVRVERPLHINTLATLSSALNNLKISSDSSPLLVIHLPSFLVTHPCVSSSSSRVYPHNVLEAKIITQCHINNLDSHSDELPAFIADIGLVTACPNVIVIGQIDIETKLFCNRLESGSFPQRFAVARIRAIDGSNFESGRHKTENIFAETVDISMIKYIAFRG